MGAPFANKGFWVKSSRHWTNTDKWCDSEDDYADFNM